MSTYNGSSNSSQQNLKESSRRSTRRRCCVIAAIVLVVVLVLVLALGLGLGLGLRDRTTAVSYPAETYALVDAYTGSTFFDNFDFFTATDPTDGYVTYVSKSEAASNNFTYVASASSNGVQPVYITAGKTANYSGVESVRIQSTKNYTQGLFVLDLVHMPYGCGTWPAFWTTDVPNNPTNGEIDVLEGVNLQTENRMTLHTSDGCTMPAKSRNETGTILENDCSTSGNSAGCGVTDSSSSSGVLSYGAGFNNNSGGVYAMDWRNNGIRIWFFPRSSLPSDLSTASLAAGKVPTMLTWGKPVANFPNTDCDITQHFKNHKVIFDLTFCGDWAGTTSIWEASTCYDPTKYKVCTDYVHANIETMTDVFWEINGVYVYQYSGAGATVVG